jgi:predicted heme/steroid binding protein
LIKCLSIKPSVKSGVVQPAYVAVNGIIYDLTQSRLWRGGVHDPSKGKAMAGRDLTEVLKDSPHGDSHLKDFPVVGYLKSSQN